MKQNRNKKLPQNRLILTRQFSLGLNMLPQFKEAMLAATRIWNSCVWHSRNIHKEEKRWPTNAELKAKFKSFSAWKELHSQSAQAVVEEYFEAVRSYKKHRENGHNEMNPPNFKPKYRLRTITWKKQGFSIKGNTLILKFSRQKEPVKISLPAEWNIFLLPNGRKIHGVPIEVKLKAVVRRQKVKNLILHITFDFGEVSTDNTGFISAYDYNSSIIARATTNGILDLFVCRELLAHIQYRNKILAEFQSKISRLKEGTRRWKKLSAAKARILHKLDHHITHMEHTLTSLFAKLDNQEGIATAVIGDLTDLRRTSRSGDKNKKASQKINQMAYNRIFSEQYYKNLIQGIKTVKHQEKYTSTTCSLCGIHKPTYRQYRGLWVCKNCGTILQADLNGAVNLLKNYVFGNCINQTFPVSFKQIRIWHWNKKLNRFVQVSPRAAV